MAKTRQIRRRIKAVSNIERITKTMQMIATARFQGALRLVTQSQMYARKIGELVSELTSALATTDEAGSVLHPLLRRGRSEGGRMLLLVISSQRGLCGGYNTAVLREVMGFLRRHAERSVDVEVVGKKAMAYFKFNGVNVQAHHAQFTDRPAYEQVEQLARRYMDGFTSGRYDTVHVAYMAFKTISRQVASVQALLPLAEPDTATGGAGGIDYDFSPKPQVLLDELLPACVKTELFQRFNEAVLGEHLARMVAMKNATDSAGKIGKQLKRRFNRARQAAITTELSEIIGGAMGLD